MRCARSWQRPITKWLSSRATRTAPAFRTPRAPSRRCIKRRRSCSRRTGRNPKSPDLMLRLIEVRSAESDLIYRTGRVKESAQIYIDLLPAAHRLSLTQPCKIECETQEMGIETALASQMLSIDPAKALEYANHGSQTGRELIARHPTDKTVKQATGSLLQLRPRVTKVRATWKRLESTTVSRSKSENSCCTMIQPMS